MNSNGENEQGQPSVDDVVVMLHQAVQHQHAGQIIEAEKAYRQVLEIDPGNAFATQLLGGLALQKDDFPLAADLFGKALVTDPGNAELHNNLGNALSGQERFDEAVSHYNSALALQPEYGKAHNNLSAALRVMGKFDEAIVHHLKALEQQPDNVPALNNYASTLKETGRPTEAIEQYNLALQIDPSNAEVHYNLGVLCEGQHQLDAACGHYQKAIEVRPGYVGALFNLANTLRSMGKFDEAITTYHEVIEHRPEHAPAHNNLGLALRLTGDRKAAEIQWRRAVELDPLLADSQVNLALCHFEEGQVAEGWERYEWRDKAGSYKSPQRHFVQPQWDGSDLKGKHIILWGEQGLADEILYASMIPDILKQGGKVSIECAPRLVKLFSRSFAAADVYPYPYDGAEQGTDHFDFQCSFPSLGRFMRPGVEAFPTRVEDYAYLKADPEKQAFWKKRLAELSPRPKIGFNWGSIQISDDSRHFYASIKEMEPLLRTPGVDFINLMYADATADIQEIQRDFGVAIHDWQDLDLKEDIEGVAGLISSLDRVVSCLSTVSELSGALGTQAAVFIGEATQATMMGTDDNIWFPNTHYYSKERSGPWQPVFAEISANLQEIFNI